ncbi:UBX domain-containing protein 11 [Geodia barretti]|uniref:UBX domain-containing protein 11 n=1 Tax=Geodia barretti TaxID=519541 RepID=A0AA35TBL6_GEOBA|nr:UBX domain-containing protein 11 [Geodia barretti]
MSSPSSTLKKVKRSPLPGACRVPFRKTEAAVPPANTSPPPSDSDLLASMAARLAQAEAQLVTTRQEVREKEGRIRELERRLSAPTPPLPHSHGTPHDNHDDLLRKKCDILQKQIQEMEEFLNDYGMIWMGSEGVRGHKEGVWLPDSSLPRNMFAVDFDLIVRNVESLNALAGEGSTAISTTPRGATLRRTESVPLTLYANGLVMFQGPFRPFSDPHTQQCVQDLMDGYFPSELQSQFPDGVPFKLTDQRHMTYEPPNSWGAGVHGSGQKLGGQARPSKLSSPHTTSKLPEWVVPL